MLFPSLGVKCTNCDQVFAHRTQLRRHFRKTHEERVMYPCEQCGKQYMSGTALRNHQRQHTGINTFEARVPSHTVQVLTP